jgi:hypothetical protein
MVLMLRADRAGAIEELLRRRGFELETEAERSLVDAVASGVETRCWSGEADVREPPERWEPEAQIRAVLLGAVLLDPEIVTVLGPRGLAISHAAVTGYLDLDESRGDVPLELSVCSLDRLTLRNARVGTLLLSGSGLHRPLDGVALSADFATIRGGVFLDDGFFAAGEVRFLSAQISGGLNCTNGSFENPGGHALSTDGSVIRGGVFLRRGFRAVGEVSLTDTEITETVELRGSFTNPGGDAIYADGIRVEGDMMFADGFAAHGEVRLLDATIAGRLNCASGAQFINPDGDAFNADGARVRNGVFFRDRTRFDGTVSLSGSEIGGGLDCSGGRFEAAGGIALTARDATIRGGVRLSMDIEGSKEPFAAQGAVEMSGTEISGGFVCREGIFNNPSGTGLALRRAVIHGSVTLDGSFSGRVVLSEAQIDGTITVEPEAVGGSGPSPVLLADATVGTLALPSAGTTLAVEGLSYSQLAPLPSTRQDLQRPLAMIREAVGVAPDGRLEPRFHPQPYRQLERVLGAFGHDDLAVVVAIARERDRLRRARLTLLSRIGGWTSRGLLGFGYRPFRSIWLLLAIVAVTALAATQVVAFSPKSPTSTPPTPAASLRTLSVGDAVGYALDGLPGIDLGVRKAWEVDPRQPWIRALLWFETLAAWVLVPLFAASVTGLIRRP